MWLLPVVAGAIVPHAPLLLEELESSEVSDAARSIREAVRAVDLHDAELVVIVSPHGGEDGIYVSHGGSLRDLGVEIDLSIEIDLHAATELARETALPTVERPPDHGITVPLQLIEWTGPVVAVGFREIATEDVGREWHGMDQAERLARAVDRLAADRRIAIIASSNGAVGLTSRAPLPETPAAHKFEEAVLELLETDLASLSEYSIVLARNGRSCSLIPLRVFAYLFADRKARVLAHEAPVGVGYIVAEVV